MNEQNDAPKLPKGWTETTVGEIRIDKSAGINPMQLPDKIFELYSVPSFESGKPEIVSGKEIGSNKQTVETNVVLLCKINPHINRVWKVGDFSENKKIASTEWISFYPHDAVDQEYLTYFFQNHSFRTFLTQNVSGVGGSLMRIKASVFANYPFPLPPLDEQARIVAKVEELFTKLDAGIDALRAVGKQLKRYRQAVLRDAVTGALTAKWRNDERATITDESKAENLLRQILRTRRQRWETEQLAKFTATGKTPKNDDWKNKYKEPAAPDTENLPELPESWTRVNVGQIILDLKYGTSQKCDYKNAGVPVLRIPNVSNGIISHSDLKYAELPKAEYEQLKLSAGDILLIRSNGSVSLVGKTALVKASEENFAYAGYLIRLKPNQNFIQSNFLQIAFSSNEMRKQIEMPARSTSGVHNINSDEVKSLTLSLPPLAEQQKIVEEVERLLSVADAVEATIEQSLKQAARLRQSILKRAFAGELVAQDDADEPAAVLLERIKHESTVQRETAKPKHKITGIQSALPFGKA